MSTLPLAATTAKAASPACEVLTFDVGAERYAISLQDIQEIRGYEAPTKLPNAQPYSLGVISLRGDAVPLLDMRVLLGAKPEVTTTTAVVIVRAEGRIAGLVVDSVRDVVELVAGQLQASPCVGDAVSAQSVLGLATVGEQLMIALNVRPYLEMTSALA